MTKESRRALQKVKFIISKGGVYIELNHLEKGRESNSEDS